MKGKWPQDLLDTLKEKLSSPPFNEDGLFVAVRSSGTDEDSASHSFAGRSIVYRILHYLYSITMHFILCLYHV